MAPRFASAVIVACTVTIASPHSGATQEVRDNTASEPDVGYAPSPAFPFGRMHPDAPSELAQFAFMVGEFDCIDEIRQQDGSWIRFRAIWNARYFLNGFGITSGPGLTFYNITENGFDWRSGGDTAGWTSTCTRRR